MGSAFNKKQDYKAAEAPFRKALNLNPKEWKSWTGLSVSLFYQGRYKEAKQACQNSLDLNPPPDARAAGEQGKKQCDEKLKSEEVSK